MEHLIVTLFKPVLEFGTRDDAIAYLLQHPVLTSPYYTPPLEAWAATLVPPQRENARRAIALKEQLWDQAKKGEIKLHAPPNVVLQLYTKVVQGKITEEYARAEASRPEAFVELMFPVVNATCDAAEELARKNWRLAAMLVRIMLAAMDARRARIEENQQAMDYCTVATWLAVASAALSDVPDGRIYYDVLRRAEPLADVVFPDEDPPAGITHRLGVLHLDPYVAGRSSDQIRGQLATWQKRLDEELAASPGEKNLMPAVEEALPKAVDYFRRASARRQGEARGKTLKALAQALVWQDILEMKVDASQIIASASEALSLLPSESHPGENAELTHIIKRFASKAGLAPPEPEAATDVPRKPTDAVAKAAKVFATPVDTWVQRIGGREAEDLFQQSASAVAGQNPKLALSLWLAIQPRMQERDEAARSAYVRAAIDYVHGAFAPDAPSADGQPLEGIAASLRQKAKRERWNRQHLAYSLLWLAASSSATNQEEEGLAVLEQCVSIDDGSDPLFTSLTKWLRATLQIGAAVNAETQKDWILAAEGFALAIGYLLNVGLPLKALQMLQWILDLAESRRPAIFEALLHTLCANALRLEVAAGPGATERVQFACRQTLSAMAAAGSVNMNDLLSLLDVAKGRRFRVALSHRGAAAYLDDPRTVEWEREIADLRAQVGPAGLAPSNIDEQALLTAYVSPTEMRGGANAAEQLRNIEIRFDSALDRALSSNDDKDDWVPTLETIQAALDDGTVLLLQYMGTAPSLDLALTTALITKEEVALSMNNWSPAPSSTEASDNVGPITSSLVSATINELRRSLNSPRGPRAADSRALEMLEWDAKLYLGGLQEKLAELRGKGKDHLCVCPHGPLHYYPFHLLGAEDEPLAATWCVTYLPNLRLLSRNRNSPLSPTRAIPELTSVGINFGANNPHHQTPIFQPELEAKTVADVYGVWPILGPDATETNVKHALANSRRFHLATHGRHNISAPAFQCLYVNPDSNSDGIVHAYELLRLDLGELDLVTLSACETALGRFDLADNVRGIPAALLIAGVSTIVGTLWPVETNTARRFFEIFYRVLKTTGKQEAFYQAQTQTRLDFPAYCDWGAFQLIGAWR